MTKTLDDIPLISERRKKLLPAGRKAQKEFIRDLLSTNQEKFEELFYELAEHDPKAWLLLYHDMQKHVVPKQSQLNVSLPRPTTLLPLVPTPFHASKMPTSKN